MFFHSVGNVKIPIDALHHFAEGVGSTSNQLTVCKLENDPFVDDVPIKMVSFHMFPNDFMDFPNDFSCDYPWGLYGIIWIN